MAKNPPTGDGHHKGAVEGRSQLLGLQKKRRVKRNAENRQFVDVKADGKKFKGVRSEENSITQNLKPEELAEYEHQMKIARRIMRENYDVLRKLAQS